MVSYNIDASKHYDTKNSSGKMDIYLYIDFLSELLPFLWKNASFPFQDNDSGHASEVTAWQKAKGMEVILPDLSIMKI
jgi:hypothetical protein